MSDKKTAEEVFDGVGPFCQSCGMPMRQEADFGTEAGGARSEDYCTYCCQNGAFTDARTMDEMIEFCLDCEKDSGLYDDRETARQGMRAWFPTLKRWRAE